MDGVNTLAEGLERFVPEDDAMRSATKRVDDKITFAGIEKHDRASAGLQVTQLTHQAEPLKRAFAQLRADHRNVRRSFFEQINDARGIYGTTLLIAGSSILL